MPTTRGVDRERRCTRADIVRILLNFFLANALNLLIRVVPYTGLFNLVRGVAAAFVKAVYS